MRKAILFSFWLFVCFTARSQILPDLNERTILFGSDRTGDNEIFVMNIDEEIPVNFTNNSADDRWARWSPEGDKIAFSSNREGNFNIFTVNIDDFEIANITNSEGNIEYFSWSPDGSKIVYAEHIDGDSEIWTINFDGTGKTQITFNDTSKVDPEWSPDGSLILYSQSMTPNSSIGNWQIFAMSPDGSIVYRLTDDDADNRNAVLSPDMQKIIYSSSRNGNTYCEKLWLANFNISNGTPSISDDINIVTTGRQQKPSWSSDGLMIVYAYTGSCSSWATTLYLMDGDGNNQSQLTFNPTDFAPSWFPVENTNRVNFENRKKPLDILIYPNPSNDIINIIFPVNLIEFHNIKLRDISGRIILSINNITGDETSISQKELKPGLYFIDISGSQNYKSKIIIK